MLKVLFSYDETEKTSDELLKQKLSSLSCEEYEVIPFNFREILKQDPTDAYTLDVLYRERNLNLRELYSQVAELSSNIDVLMAGSYNIYHPDFLKSLRGLYKVLLVIDDPQSAYKRTVPYVHAFSHAFCVNIMYDEKTREVDKLKEWGAKRADWAPILTFQCNPNTTEQEILNKERDIDLIYVGGRYRSKIDRIMKLKKAFGRQFKLYGKRWGLKATVYGIIKARTWVFARYLPVELCVPNLLKTKIGINMHETVELGNTRLYMLPLNGVMQICDCPESVGEVFEVGKEIIAYRNIDEAIDLIKHYLEHDEERKKIALAGFRRARRDYTIDKIFRDRIMKKVKEGMLEDGITHSKDGEQIVLDVKI